MPSCRKQLFSFLAQLPISEFAVEKLIDPELLPVWQPAAV